LLHTGRPYSTASTIFYFLYALPLFGLLLYLSRQFLDGKFSLQQWMPVMLTGVILLNPRIQEYDFAPLTLLMALTLYRVIAAFTDSTRATVFSFLFFGVINIAVVLIAPIDTAYDYLRSIQGFLLVGFAAAGCLNLLQLTRGSDRSRSSPYYEVLAVDSSIQVTPLPEETGTI
jgi:hypothetical protein